MDHFISTQMRNRSQIWRILVGTLIMSIVYILPVLGLGVMIGYFVPQAGPNFLFGLTPLSLAVLLATFIPIWFGVRFAMFWPIGMPLQALYGVTQRINWRDFGIAAAVGICGVAAYEIVMTFVLTDIATQPQMIHSLDIWVMWLLPVMALILFQAGAEELVFRGYFLRLIWARGGRLWWAIFVPSFVFGLGHFAPSEFGANAWLYTVNTTVTGMILCAITLHRGNIGAAFGLHFAVNVFGLLIKGNAGYLSGMALFLASADLTAPSTGLSLAAMTLVEIVLYVVWARRTYGKILP